MADELTDADLAAMAARCRAADSEDAWGRGRVALRWTREGPGRPAALWYEDGDQCAAVHGNPGMGMVADSWAEFFAHARGDLPRCLAEIGRLRAENELLRGKVLERCEELAAKLMPVPPAES